MSTVTEWTAEQHDYSWPCLPLPHLHVSCGYQVNATLASHDGTQAHIVCWFSYCEGEIKILSY